MIPYTLAALTPIFIIIVAVASIVVLVMGLIFLSFFGVWLKARFSGVPISIFTLVAMRLRNVPHSLIVDARITAAKAGINISINEIETHYLAGGDVIQTIQGLINAEKAGIAFSWNQGCGIDLATKGTEKSVIEAVRTSINPKVIDCPATGSGRNTIDGVAKDGIQVKVRARVTVRSNLDRYVGSAQEETIIARVGEGIVTTIGSAESYKWVLENPDSISRTVLKRGLDTGTAFEILSIDIADIDVGENVGAQLQEAQAVADKNVAQAKAEMRRAAAVALEQEMKAKVQEMQAKVVEAESTVPLAMAEAFRQGNLGVMDYMRLRNIESDTDMRNSIAKPGESKDGQKK